MAKTHRKLTKFTIDHIRKGADIKIYHQWLKEQRIRDFSEVRRIRNKIINQRPEVKEKRRACNRAYKRKKLGISPDRYRFKNSLSEELKNEG